MLSRICVNISPRLLKLRWIYKQAARREEDKHSLWGEKKDGQETATAATWKSRSKFFHRDPSILFHSSSSILVAFNFLLQTGRKHSRNLHLWDRDSIFLLCISFFYTCNIRILLWYFYLEFYQTSLYRYVTRCREIQRVPRILRNSWNFATCTVIVALTICRSSTNV